MTVRDRYSGIQTILGKCNEGGCHFLTLLTIIEEYHRDFLGEKDYCVDLIEAIRISQSRHWIDNEFEVKDALALLTYYTNKKWTREVVKKLPEIKDNQWTEVVHYNKRTGFKHFHRRAIDTLVNSTTVKEGIVLEYYIWTCEV